MNTLNAILYNETLMAISLLQCGLERFNKQFTESNKRELEAYIKGLDKVSLEFESCYRGPMLIKLEVLQRVQLVRGEAIIAIHEFNQLSNI